MKADRLVEILSAEFGKESVLLHSEFHIQVVSGTKKHDVWLNKFGELKWKLAHSRQTVSGSPDRLIRRIQDYEPTKTDFANMQAAQQLCNVISRVGRQASNKGIRNGIFCDAGFKDGKARISIVAILNDRVEAFSDNIEADAIHTAERNAIEIALSKYTDPTLPIYSDSQSVVKAFGTDRIRWIPRDENRPADSLANLRKR